MAQFVNHCPSCHKNALRIRRIVCESCDLTFEGNFEPSPLQRLDPDELKFVEDFILTGGSLKDLAAQMDFSYPTVRNKLNDIIENLKKFKETEKFLDENMSQEKVLSKLENGQISVKEALRLLKKK